MRTVDRVFEPVPELVPVASPVPEVTSEAAVTEPDDDPLVCVAAESLPASALPAMVGDPSCAELLPVVASALLPTEVVVGVALVPSAGGADSAGVGVAVAGTVAGSVGDVVGGDKVVAKLEVDLTLTQSRS